MSSTALRRFYAAAFLASSVQLAHADLRTCVQGRIIDVAATGGDCFEMYDDTMYHISSNTAPSWAKENMPADVFLLVPAVLSVTYRSSSYAVPQTYSVCKHNMLTIYNSISQDPKHAGRTRNFNDFANDVVIPQLIFVTPNMGTWSDYGQVDGIANNSSDDAEQRHFALMSHHHLADVLPSYQ
ncbi:hypothetical protein C8R44DRAFT_889444 [Mycena epipterygia]|nr:hypothetical protein C8R44DRAFT_889444 [Mycena epipterygia]